MERPAFELLRTMERSWWYRARARAVETALRKAGVRRTDDILDYGAGFGGMYGTLSKFGDRIWAYEPDAQAGADARKRGYVRVFSTDTDALRDGAYDLVGAFDVVEHIEKDREFLSHAFATLKAGGYIAIAVPAFPFLWSIHDVNHHHFRRYTKATMGEALEQAGFTLLNKSYWNMSLFIPGALMRLLGRSGESALGMPRWLDSLLSTVLSLEMALMRIVSLPFGTGLVVVAQKKSGA